MRLYQIETYTSQAGRAPLEIWVQSLKDNKARLAVYARIERAAIGDFGDWKAISGAKGIFEMRIHYAQGYRVFYTIVGQTVILLLAGSTKDEQNRTISKAKEYLADYNERMKP